MLVSLLGTAAIIESRAGEQMPTIRAEYELACAGVVTTTTTTTISNGGSTTTTTATASATRC